MAFYETTDDSIIVQHEVECVVCTGQTTEKVTGGDQAFSCDECGVKVVEEKGEYTVDGAGQITSSVETAFSLRRVV